MSKDLRNGSSRASARTVVNLNSEQALAAAARHWQHGRRTYSMAVRRPSVDGIVPEIRLDLKLTNLQQA